jgi:hypothetical protein
MLQLSLLYLISLDAPGGSEAGGEEGREIGRRSDAKFSVSANYKNIYFLGMILASEFNEPAGV